MRRLVEVVVAPGAESLVINVYIGEELMNLRIVWLRDRLVRSFRRIVDNIAAQQHARRPACCGHGVANGVDDSHELLENMCRVDGAVTQEVTHRGHSREWGH